MTENKLIWHIWHKKPEIPDEDRTVAVQHHSGLYTVGSEFEYDFDGIIKWAYLDDLLACEQELDRTRKALDVAVDALREIHLPKQWCPVFTEQEIAKKTLDEINEIIREK